MTEPALTIEWDGRPIGRLRVEDREVRAGGPDLPPAVRLRGSFSPAPAFADCVGYFDECNRREGAYQAAEEGEGLGTAEEALRGAMLLVLRHVRVPGIAGRLRNCWIEGGRASLTYEPSAEAAARRADLGVVDEGRESDVRN